MNEWVDGDLATDPTGKAWRYEGGLWFELGSSMGFKLGEISVGKLSKVYMHTADELVELQRNEYLRGWRAGYEDTRPPEC